jgi:membrane protein
MARLSDVPKVLRSVGAMGLARRVWREVGDDNLFTWAAALAYSWLFAAFPFLIFLLSLLPYLPEEAKAELAGLLRSTMPQQAAATLWDNVVEVLSRPQRGLLGIGLVLTLWGASGGMNATIAAMERCYELERGRAYMKMRLVAILLTMVVVTLVLAVLALLPIGTIATNWVIGHSHRYVSGPLLWTWQIARYPAALVVMFTIVNVLYHYGPSIKQRFVFVTPGALFSVVVWVGLGFVFRIYVDRFAGFSQTYGTVGGVAILLFFFYIDALVLLVGAEINSEIDFEVLGVPRGSRDFTRAVGQSNKPVASPDGGITRA